MNPNPTLGTWISFIDESGETRHGEVVSSGPGPRVTVRETMPDGLFRFVELFGSSVVKCDILSEKEAKR